MANKTGYSLQAMLVIFLIGVTILIFLSALAVAQVQPPVTTASLAGTRGNNGWYRSDVNVTFAATDYSGVGINHTEYNFNGSPTVWFRYTGPITVTKEGITPIYYRTWDNGSTVEPTKTVQVNIDRTPPTLSFTLSPAPNANGWCNRTVHLYFAYADSGSEIADYPKDMTLDNDGTYSALGGTAMDMAGNAASVTVPTFGIDRTQPVVGGLTLPKSALAGDYVPVSASVVEANPDRVEWDWGDGTGSAATIGNNVARGTHAYAQGGTYPITLTVIDRAGNVARSAASLAVTGSAPIAPATPTPTPGPGATPTPTAVPLPSGTPTPAPAAGALLIVAAFVIAGLTLAMRRT